MIRITRQTDYGIVLMIHFAMRPMGAMCNARDLAEEASLPFPMVSKILKMLAREELLVSHRGVKGGYSLSRTPEEIPVIEIIRALEGPIGITTCTTKGAVSCSQSPMCPAKDRWQKINRAVIGALGGISLADMVEGELPRFGSARIEEPALAGSR